MANTVSAEDMKPPTFDALKQAIGELQEARDEFVRQTESLHFAHKAHEAAEKALKERDDRVRFMVSRLSTNLFIDHGTGGELKVRGAGEDG